MLKEENSYRDLLNEEFNEYTEDITEDLTKDRHTVYLQDGRKVDIYEACEHGESTSHLRVTVFDTGDDFVLGEEIKELLRADDYEQIQDWEETLNNYPHNKRS